MMQKNQGFTLLELVITVAIIGIIVAFALPAYTTSHLKSVISSTSLDLENILSKARIAALERSTSVSVCPVADVTDTVTPMRCLGWNTLITTAGDRVGLISYQNSTMITTGIAQADIIDRIQFQSSARGSVNLAITPAIITTIGFSNRGFINNTPAAINNTQVNITIKDRHSKLIDNNGNLLYKNISLQPSGILANDWKN